MMRTAERGLAETLWPAVRRRVLGLLLAHPDQELHLREIVRRTRLSAGTVQREVIALAQAGILQRRRQGAQVYYRADLSCPIFPELRGLMLKTTGLTDVLREVLEPLRERIELAAIFGSLAAGESTSRSDVDLLVVGEVSLRALAPRLRAAQEALSREINPMTMTIREFRDRAAHGDHFLGTVLESPMIFLIGGQDDLSRLAPVGAPAEA